MCMAGMRGYRYLEAYANAHVGCTQRRARGGVHAAARMRRRACSGVHASACWRACGSEHAVVSMRLILPCHAVPRPAILDPTVLDLTRAAPCCPVPYRAGPLGPVGIDRH